MYRSLFLVLTGIGILSWDSASAQSIPDQVVITNRAIRGELTFRVGGGLTEYGEDVAGDPVDSDFEAQYGFIGIDYVLADRFGLNLRFRADLWATEEDSEEWQSSGELLQRNDLQISGVNLLAECGIDLLHKRQEELNLWIGLGYRAQGYERDRFRSFASEAPDAGDIRSVGEDYTVTFLHLGIDGRIRMNPKLSLRGSAGMGSVIFNEAENDLLGTIEGNGGYTGEISVELSYAVAQRHATGVGVRYDYQQLEGERERTLFLVEGGIVQGGIEWPDNELEQYSFHFFWRVQL